MNEFKSTAAYIEEPIDSRVLSLRANFRALSREQVNEIARLLKRFMDGSFPELYLSWDNGGRKWREKAVNMEIESGICGVNGAFLSFIGWLRSDIVYNAISFKKAWNAMVCPSVPQMYDNCAADYPDYYENNIRSVVEDPEQLKSALLDLFAVPAHESVKRMHGADLKGGVTARKAADGSFFGEMELAISLFCVNSKVDMIADKLNLLAGQLCNELVNINAHVGISVPCIGSQSPYMKYFGCGGGTPDYKNGFFMCSLSWANIVSRMTVNDFDLTLSPDTGIDVSVLPSGAVMVRSRKKVMEANVTELCQMKRKFYAALYPGKSFLPYGILKRGMWSQISRPRCDWELVPVFEDEIVTHKEGIEFRHNSFCG